MTNNFLLGAATAAYQVEGNNHNSDFWIMEHLKNSSFKEKSGEAVDHYNRYEEDIQLMKKAGMNAYRFSIEWARIEPEKGIFNREATEHYRSVLECCHENKITPIVTMHHFSSPQWIIREGGWENEKIVDYFKNYCRYVVTELGDLMEFICTINEANMRNELITVMKSFAKSLGINIQVGVKLQLPEEMMVGQREAGKAFGGIESADTFLSPCTPKGDLLIMQAHEAARDVMRTVDNRFKIGLTLSLHDIQIVGNATEKAGEMWDDEFKHYLPFIEKDDFFGLQNYTRTLVGEEGELSVPEEKKKTQMGYEFYPQALENVIRKVSSELNLPIIVTENGVATDNDKDRVTFIEEALSGVKRCVADGIPILGYMHWSLLDNFEWQLGYSKTFGLIEVDRKTQTRKPKESFYRLAEIWEKEIER